MHLHHSCQSAGETHSECYRASAFVKAVLHSGAEMLASDSDLDNVHLQEAAMATSVMGIHVKAPQLHAKLCQVSRGRSHHLLLISTVNIITHGVQSW